MMPTRAALVALLLLAPFALAQDAADACEEGPGASVSCRWEFTAEDGDVFRRTFDLPVFTRTHAAFVVTLLGKDNGWKLAIEAQNEEGDWREVSSTEHAAQNDASYRHMENSAHILLAFDAEPHRVSLSPNVDPPAPLGVTDVPASAGRWTIAYQGELLPLGDKPSRPAATAALPHLADLRGDADEPAYDIVAAWFDDARLGDGLMDVHMQLAELTQPIPIRDSLDPIPADAVGWKLAWGIEDERYFVEWRGENFEADGQTYTAFTCKLYREAAADDASATDVVIAHPACGVDFELAELFAFFPEASIGGPPDGLVFDHPEARTRIYATGRNVPDVVDDATKPSFLFALGGPRVWAELDGGALGAASLPWYRDPFSSQNVLDTIQVLASALAATTFLVGLYFVARRRRKTHALLHRVDDAIHGNVDSRETLLRLGRLETEFSEMYRKGKLTEGQYQVLSQRIATVATRHALRHTLGLDDGVPGDATPGTPVRIDVADGPKKRIRP